MRCVHDIDRSVTVCVTRVVLVCVTLPCVYVREREREYTESVVVVYVVSMC